MFIYIMCTCKEGVLQSSCRILNRSGHSHVYVLENFLSDTMLVRLNLYFLFLILLFRKNGVYKLHVHCR